MTTDILSVFFMIIGTFFMLVASIGILRLPDFYTRIHAQTKSSTFGLAGLLIAAALSLWSMDTTVKVLLALAFHFLTNPVGAHMITRAAYYHLKVEFWKNTIAEEWKDRQL